MTEEKRRPGRPPLPKSEAVYTVRFNCYVTPEQKNKLMELGAGQWIREKIDEVLESEKKGKSKK